MTEDEVVAKIRELEAFVETEARVPDHVASAQLAMNHLRHVLARLPMIAEGGVHADQPLAHKVVEDHAAKATAHHARALAECREHYAAKAKEYPRET